MATVKAHVFVSSSGQAVIHPPVVIAKKNDQVEIVNHTDQDICVIYPEKVFDDGSGNLKRSGKVAAGKGKASHQVDNTATVGVHRFKVFCFATDSFAQGNSDPEFIIEP